MAFNFDFDMPDFSVAPASPASKDTAITVETEEQIELREYADAVTRAELLVNNAEKAEEQQKEMVSNLMLEVAELERLLEKKRAETTKARADLWDFKKPIREAKEQLKAAEQQYSIQKSTFEDRKRMASLSVGYEAIAKEFDWRTGLNGNENLKALPHQWDGMRYLATAGRAILGDGMGVGKTLTSIGAMDISEAKRVLIVAPADITTNFLQEVKMWAAHRRVFNLKGMSKVDRDNMVLMANFLPDFVTIINYEAWRKDNTLLRTLVNMHFDTIIMDEAHVAKETDSVTHQGLRYLIGAINRCPICEINIPVDKAVRYSRGTEVEYDVFKCPQCGWDGSSWASDNAEAFEVYQAPRSIKRVWPMTGTPILNKPQDLFALLTLIDPLNFDNKARFLREYAEMDPYTGKWGFRTGGLETLMRRLSGKFLARTMSDAGITLPPQKPIRHEISLERYEKQQWVIDQITKHAAIMLDENKTLSIPAIIAIITRQRQANVWPGGIELKGENGEIVWRVSEDIQESAKIDKAVELVKEITAEGHRVVIFSQFSTALREMHDRINGMKNANDDEVKSVVFDGATKEDVRAQIKTNFDKKLREPKKWDVVLANYKTGGTGLNLTAATHTIIMDKEWNPGKENQALARTLRIGQDETTFVHYLVIPGTIDEWMEDIVQEKADLIAGFDAKALDLKAELLKRLNGGS
jgi:SNF2 family DNA or RNA helicase